MGFRIVLESYEKEPGITEVVIPEGVTKIGWRAFCGCESLTSITIPEGVNVIGENAFAGCSSLTSITIPEGVNVIGENAFAGCSRLTSITIPEGVNVIGENAFAGCSRLTSITIPEGVTGIGERAFSDCTSLTSITIPDSVTEIGRSAFCGCSSLTSITIPEGVKEIGRRAFAGCSSLTSITIPEGVKEIGECAFADCKNLQCIDLPASLKEIDETVFWGCHKDLHSSDGEKIYHVTSVSQTSVSQWTGDWLNTMKVHRMLYFKDYSVQMDHEVKYEVLWAHFYQVPDEPELLAYIKKKFSEMFPFAIEHDDVETVKFVCEQGTLLTTRNIGKMVEVAFEHEKESESRKRKDNSAEIVNTLIEYCGTIAEKASLAQLHRLFDIANAHDLTELKMRIMRVKHERFPKDEQKENDFSLD